MQIVSAIDVAPSDILDAMLNAYSDYSVPLEMDLPMFERMLTQRGFDPALSMLAEEDGVIAAFWMTGVEAEARPGVAYTATVGTRVAHRRKGLAQELFAALKPRAKAAGMSEVLLEVIEDNDKAVKLYEGLGFARTARVECFKGPPPDTGTHEASFQSVSVEEAHAAGKAFRDWRPAWQNDTHGMGHIAEVIDAILIRRDGACVGYGMINTSNGMVTQIALDAAHRRKGFGRALLAHWAEAHGLEAMVTLNILDTDQSSTEFFRSLGWENHVNQFVMAATL